MWVPLPSCVLTNLYVRRVRDVLYHDLDLSGSPEVRFMFDVFFQPTWLPYTAGIGILICISFLLSD